MWRSKTGWTLAAIYLIAAVTLFGYALTCGNWFCDFAALPVFFPAGAMYWWAYQFSDKWFVFGYVASPFKAWGLIIPTVVTNILFYYLFGLLLGWLAKRLSFRKLTIKN